MQAAIKDKDNLSPLENALESPLEALKINRKGKDDCQYPYNVTFVC
jgi:hypothetical protein